MIIAVADVGVGVGVVASSGVVMAVVVVNTLDHGSVQ
jgi:hypothetical protein